MKLYTAYYDAHPYPFHALNPDPEDHVSVQTPDEFREYGALIIHGGSDIDPAFYNHPRSSRTYTAEHRDKVEWNLIQGAIEKGFPIFGICRGAQMACAAAGGYLLQHVHGHHGEHDVKTADGTSFEVNSIHHQMMVGQNVPHELLAWSPQPLSHIYYYKNDDLFRIPEGWVEPEFYYFPKIKAFAVQWHPEMMDEESPATQYILEKIRERL